MVSLTDGGILPRDKEYLALGTPDQLALTISSNDQPASTTVNHFKPYPSNHYQPSQSINHICNQFQL